MRELDPMVRGAATYVADLPLDGVWHAVFVRSPVAHALVNRIDTSTVIAPAVVLTAHELALAPILGFDTVNAHMARPPLATDRVRFVGDPIAVVLAPTLAEAHDAAEVVRVDYDPLLAVTGVDAARATGAPLLFPEAGTNVAFSAAQGVSPDDALDGADHVVRARFAHQRLAAAPLETNAVLARPQPDGTLVVHASSQAVHTVRDAIARALGRDNAQVRVIAPHVGGGFGGKFHTCYEYVVIAAAAVATGRAIRWIESRHEHLLGACSGRGQYQDVALGLRADGTFVGIVGEFVTDAGAYPSLGAVMANATGVMATGPYRIPKYSVTATGVVTNTSSTIAYRGAGRPEAAVMLERIIDLAARELGIDRVELRRRNLIAPDEFPYTAASGLRYDSGDYGHALDVALDAIGYHDFRRDGAAAHLRRGIGFAIYMDVTPFRLVTEYAGVRIALLDGAPHATVTAGTCNFGQAHETLYATVLAPVLDIDRDRVTLIDRDTGLVPRGIGSASARSAQICGSSVHEAAIEVRRVACERAADLLEARADDVVFAAGRFAVRGVPARTVGWSEVLSSGPIEFDHDWSQPGNTFPFGVHAAVVEVDTGTGEVRLERFVAVDDCGTMIVPDIVDGQTQGGAAQGIAAALYEEVLYDRDGTPRTASFADYLIPSAADLPRVETRHTETPTPLNPIGAKGIGQSGCIGAPGAVINAVLDALAPLGVRDLQPPFTPEKLWRALRDAS